MISRQLAYLTFEDMIIIQLPGGDFDCKLNCYKDLHILVKVMKHEPDVFTVQAPTVTSQAYLRKAPEIGRDPRGQNVPTWPQVPVPGLDRKCSSESRITLSTVFAANESVTCCKNCNNCQQFDANMSSFQSCIEN